MGHTNPLYRIASIAGAVLALAALGCAWFASRGSVPAVAAGSILGCGIAGVALAAVCSALAARAARNHAAALEKGFHVQIAALDERVAGLRHAKAESDAILGSVRAHLMLVDPSYLIASRYSDELQNVFHQRELGNENFLNLLQRLLSARMFQTARDYLSLLFDKTKKERTVLKVNPLDEIEITVAGADGNATLRYLSFGFRRLVEDGEIARVLVTVEDVTERSMRERALRESEQQKVRQFELLIGILHVAPRELDGFVALAKEQLGAVDDALRASDFASATVGQTALLRQRLDVVLQRVHNIKGNASLLRLDYFEHKAQVFEQQIVDLRHRGALGGDDFLSVVVGLAAFRADLDDLQTLRAKLASIERSARIAEEVGDELVTSVTELAASLGKRLGKAVSVDADGFDSRALPPEQRLVVKDVLIQLTRNSIVHGVESPEERLGTGKDRVATIEIHPTPGAPADSFAFTFRDDGRGLDASRIRSRAVASGMLASDEADGVEDSDVASFIFVPGFSTADRTTPDAGRGMGMNVIKQRVVDDCGGEIAVNSEAGGFCEFSFVLPLHARAIAS